MPRLTDPAAVRRILQTDSRWAVYALGDLAPHRFAHSTWLHVPGDEPALVLLYREFSTPVLVAVGRPAAVRPLLDEVHEESMFLHVQPGIVDLLRPRYRMDHENAMWRMILDPTRFPSGGAEGVVPLGMDDLTALQRLYADGEPAGEVPHFFFPSMLEDHAFFGIWEGSDLITAGGTHLVEPAEGIAAIGNIYTRRDRRGRGLATRVTHAITAELLRRGLPIIALNVVQGNAPAVHVYEKLGFARYCPFVEAEAIQW